MKIVFKFCFKLTIVIIVIIVVVRSSFIGVWRIVGNAMHPTLMQEMKILTFTQSYGLRIPFFDQALFTYDVPSRNDIITFKHEGHVSVSRVIGLPNEIIEVRGMKVYINGKLLKEPQTVNWRDGGIRDFGPFTIPNDSVFVMGDNRDRSRDSRFYDRSAVPVKSIIGKSFYIFPR